jgi:deoxyxylulose-5-phosphate synthase
VLGLPTKFIPHAKPDVILGKFGLDASGLERTVREMLAQ